MDVYNNAEKEVYEEKYKELDSICSPIMTKIAKDLTPPDTADPNAMPPGMTADRPPHIPGMKTELPHGMSQEMMDEMMSKMAEDGIPPTFEPQDNNIQIEEVD